MFGIIGGVGRTDFNEKVENISIILGTLDDEGTPGTYIINANDIYMSPSDETQAITSLISDIIKSDIESGADEFSTSSITFEGNMKIGVNYDGITSSGTSNTGKIIAGGFINNGTITLVKSTDTQTSRTLLGELLANDPTATKTSINDVIITVNKVSMNPFSLDSNLSPTSGWTSLTTADRVRADGLYAVDQVYTRTLVDGNSAGSVNSLFIPRSRVNLDNAENHGEILNSEIVKNDNDFLDVKYIGNFSGKYNETAKNYGYKNNGNGIVITSGRSFTDKLNGAVSFQYMNSNINYDGTPEEKIDSLSFAGALKYDINNFDLGLLALVEKNSHDKTINMVNNSSNVANFDSTVGIFSTNVGYKYKLGNDFNLIPKLELGLIRVHEEKEEYGQVVVAEMSKTSGFVKPSISLEKTYGNFKFNTGLEYNVYLGNGLHESREVENTSGLLEVPELEYGKGTLNMNLGLDYKVTDNLSFNASYEYLRNKEFNNNNAVLGVNYKF